MKLHLPKLLLTAVLAVCASPAALGLSVTTEGSREITIDTSTNYYGANLRYNSDGGKLDFIINTPSSFTTTFDLDYDAFTSVTEATDILSVKPTDGTIWGITASTSDTVNGRWGDNRESNTTSSGENAVIMSADNLANLAVDKDGSDQTTNDKVVSGLKLTIQSASPGVNLIKTVEENGQSVDKTVYYLAGLRQGGKVFDFASVNKNLVTSMTASEVNSITFTNASNTWSKTFDGDKVVSITDTKIQLTGGTNGTATTNTKPIVVGGTGQLHLEAWGKGNVLVDDTIYLAGSTHGDVNNFGVIRISNDDTGNHYTTNISGDIYLVEDSSIKGTGSEAITLSGTITDKSVPANNDTTANGNYTLTLGGGGITVSGKVDVGGLAIVQGYSSGNSHFAGTTTLSSTDAKVGKLSVGTNATLTVTGSLTVGSTITNNGSLELNGSFALSGTDLSGFDKAVYSTGGTTNGLSTYGTLYTLVSGTGTLSGSTTQVTYNGKTHNIADGIKIEEGTAYVVAAGTVQVGGDNAAADTKDAPKFVVLDDAILQLNAREADAALSAGNVIATAEGEGVIDLHTTATINDASDNSVTATTFNGGIKVSSGGVLQLCDNRFPASGTGETSNRTIDLSSLSGIELAGGELRYRGASSSLGNITVSANSTLYVFDMKAANNEVTVEKLDLTSSAELSLTSRWKSTTNIKVLSGDGTLNVSAPTETQAPKLVKIASTNSFTGKINQTGGTIKATAGLTVGEITQTAGTLQLSAGKTTITKGMDVQTVDVTGLDMLVLGEREGNSTTETYKIGQITGTTKLEVNEGTLELGAQKVNSVSLLDLSAADKSDAAVTVKNGGTLNVTDSLWMSNRDANKINLEENAQLNATYNVGSNHQINIKGKEGGATLTNSANSQYSLAQTSYTISNADVTIADNGSAANVTEVTLSNILDGSSLTNSSTKTLKTTNGYSNFTAIDAKSGDINMTYFNQQGNQGTLESLSIGNDRTIGLYKAGVPATPGTANEMSITTKALTVGTNATLNANLVLANGATVTMDGALTMGSTLTLGTGMELDGALLTSVTGLTAGNTVDLFTGVDGLTLGSSSYDANTTLELGTETLSSYFGNVTNPDIYLGYDGQKVYAGVMQAPVTPAVPEPTTATLSLLALAALAARRRRR